MTSGGARAGHPAQARARSAPPARPARARRPRARRPRRRRRARSGSAPPLADGFQGVPAPGAAAPHELVLNQEVRADGGMAALIGDNGQAVFDELDAQASAFSQESLEPIAHLVDTGADA